MEADATRLSSTSTSTRATRRKPRGRGIRVRTGCSTCRQRHLKCDETQPICRACQKSARDCIYPRQQEEAARETPRREADVELPTPSASHRNGDAPEVATGPVNDHDGGDVAPDQVTRAQNNEPAGRSPKGFQGEIGQSHRLAMDGAATDRINASGERSSDIPDPHGGLLVEHPASLYDESTTYLAEGGFRFDDQNMGIDVYDPELFGISPEASFGGWPTVSAEAASKWWFGLLAADITNGSVDGAGDALSLESHGVPIMASAQDAEALGSAGRLIHVTNEQPATDNGLNEIVLTETEVQLVHHYVLHLSPWLDVTDPDDQFAVVVPDLALRNRGLACAILALSSLHLSLDFDPRCSHSNLQIDPTAPMQYYNESLRYLQREMSDAAFLRSEELLATVLIISTFEMIETRTLDSAWENHLKGVFWIQRSQLIHGESEGLKKRIWWAWIRQDIWAAFRRRRQILSFYKVTRECATLDFWELVDRAVYLLGQCVNYASTKEEDNGRIDIRKRVNDSTRIWEKLEEWSLYFKKHDRRLPASELANALFSPIWINPPAASLAVQVHHFARLLLLECTPALRGMKELIGRKKSIQEAVEVICGIASSTVEAGATIASTQCVFAAGHHVQDPMQRTQIVELLQSHRERTGWPHYDIAKELENFWASADGGL